MWTVLYLANSMKIAQEIEDCMTAEGLLVKLRACDESQDESNENGERCVEVLVPNNELEKAHKVIIENGF